jgi:hypothetical protein
MSDHIHQPVRRPGTDVYECSCGINQPAASWKNFQNIDVVLHKTASYANILRGCAEIAEDREPKYGDAVKNMQSIADIARVAYGLNLTAENIAQVMDCVKLSRDLTMHQDDNIVDGINYRAIQLACRKESISF